MIIKRFTIGSDDDDFTLMSLIGTKAILPHISNDPLQTIRAFEKSELPHRAEYFTEYLDEFVDNEFWSVAYQHGFRTFASMKENGQSNEIVYLVNMEASI